jgi:FAD/FMN-containing dehydrogenase
MIGNNSCGATAQAYGKTVDNLVRLEVLTHDGERFWAGRPATRSTGPSSRPAAGGRRAGIYRAPRELSESCADQIHERWMTV